MERLILANLHYLKQAEALLVRLEDEKYVAASAAFYDSSVGGTFAIVSNIIHLCSKGSIQDVLIMIIGNGM